MEINKIIYGGNVLIDLSPVTVTAATLGKGYTAINANGELIMGTAETVPTGGTTLNFSVVGGTTQPASPSENTIWVNTSTEITEWEFSASAPASPVAGMVWFLTWVESSVPFNALQQNGINLCPMKAQQYIDGVWVYKEAQSYQGSSWKDWFLYIVDIAATHMEVAGALNLLAYRPSTSSSTVTKPNQSISSVSGMTLSLPDGDSGTAGSLFTSRKVDLTGYSTMKIYVESASTEQSNGYVRFGATKSGANNYVVSAAKTICSGENGSVSAKTISLDVSDLTGTYYLFINLYGGGAKSIKFSKWWLEP